MEDAENLKLAKYQLQTERPKQTRGQVCQAVVISSGRSGSNQNFLIYDIQVVDNGQYKDKTCIMSAPRRCSFPIGERVKVELYKGTRFNYLEQGKGGK